MNHPRSAFGASPSRGPRPAAPSRPASAWTGRGMAASRGHAACKAHQRTGRAGSAAAAWMRRFVRRGWRAAQWTIELEPHARTMAVRRWLNICFASSGAATRQPGRARRLAEAVFAALRRPCAARVRGPVAEPVVACETSNTDAVAGKAAGGAWAGRIGAAEERRASGRAPWRASCSDSSRLSERSERSERSELSDGPEDRAPQGPRSAAKGQPSEPRPGPARRLARADASTTKRSLANGPIGPKAATRTSMRILRRGSRVAPWSN